MFNNGAGQCEPPSRYHQLSIQSIFWYLILILYGTNKTAGHWKPRNQFYLLFILYSLLGSIPNNVRNNFVKFDGGTLQASTTNSPYFIVSLALILFLYETILSNLMLGEFKPLNQIYQLSILYSLLGSNPYLVRINFVKFDGGTLQASTTNSPYCIFSLALILMPYGTILSN